MEKEEGIVVPVEELDIYFFFLSADSASSPISKHVEAIHEQLNKTFPTDPMLHPQFLSKLINAVILTN